MKQQSALYRLLLVTGVICLASYAMAETVNHHGHKVEITGDAYACIACHDGQIASNVSICTVRCDFRTPHSLLRSYPPEGKEKQFVPLEEVQSAGIPFFEGKIICQSCHDLRNSRKNHLAVESEEQNLCSKCHLN